MYDEIIDLEEKADKLHDRIGKIYILDMLKHDSKNIKRNSNAWEDLTILERKKLVDWVDYIYYKQEMNLSLGCICDTTMQHRKAILSDKYDKWEFFKILATRWL